MTDESRPILRGGFRRHRRGPAQSAILLLHGGQERSDVATQWRQPSVLRLFDMYAGLRTTAVAAAVYLLRYRTRGWNAGPAGAPAPVMDARWALDQISERHPGVRIALLGYSMGGRVAFAMAGDERVSGICALAPWLPGGEPVAVAATGDQRFVLAHGTADRMTSAPGSLQFARRLRAAGAPVVRFEAPGETHSLLREPLLWHRFAVTVTRGLAGDLALPSSLTAAMQDSTDATLRLQLNKQAYR